MFTRSLRLSLAALLPAGAAAAQAARPSSVNADVPVSKVVLFSSGVGYFEHTGMIEILLHGLERRSGGVTSVQCAPPSAVV